ncbi:hypothetical protein BJV82DRAFT_611221 [Fennellomyces sp. T-0311]|nr:hypothetical protein BJV82DRAFT_611221 [Fennellomyces sp. T-0311]
MSSIVERANAEEIHHAATIIVIAPTTKEPSEYNYKVLMVKQSPVSLFGNAHVFPGGELSENDKKWKSGDAYDEFSSKICAIRETFQESGLLLTIPPAHTVLSDDLKNYWRKCVHRDTSKFKTMCDTFRLKPAVDNLIPFASIITPFSFPRRHKVQVYLTILDPSVPIIDTKADGNRAIKLDWFTPRQAMTRWDERTIFVHTPQWYCLNSMVPITDYESIIQAGIGGLRTPDGQPILAMPQFGNVGSETTEKFSYQSFWSYPGDEKYIDIRTGKATGSVGDRHRIYIRGWNGNYTFEKNIDPLRIKRFKL